MVEDGPESDTAQQQVSLAPVGTATTLDVATWNLDWFGSQGLGPKDDALQLANVRDAILGTDFDVWGLEEVASDTAFTNLLSQLPGYEGLPSNDARVTSGSAYYTTAEQKVALVWKASLATLVSARLILTANNTDFGGRPPLEVKLNITLNGTTEQHVFIVLHMKADSDSASWQRRVNASAALKTYLDSTYPTGKVIVLGDFNDGLLASISSKKASPYANFVSDTARYGLPTLSLAQSKTATYCSGSIPIDQQINTREQFADLVDGSVQVYRLDSVVSGYCSNTSDHFPVLARYRVASGPGPASAKPFINEVLANEPGSATAGEFVEIVNPGTSTTDLSGWTLSVGSTIRHTFASGSVLSPGKAIVVFGSAAGIPAGLANAVASSAGKLGLSNSGGSVALSDASGAAVDSLAYAADLAALDGVSMNRSPDGQAGGSLALHTTLSGLKASPGVRADGSAF
jgi:endonuclease/exonuclease/phosphatase family metal-dependent hydrolase